MSKQNYTPILIGGGVLAAVFLFSKTGSGTTSLLSTSSTPGTFTDATGHAVTRQPTAAENAGLINPNYQLTPQNLTDYYNNYLYLRQGMNDSWIHNYGNLNAALQAHWNLQGCAQRWTFIPLVTPVTTPYPGPHYLTPSGFGNDQFAPGYGPAQTNNSSGGGGGSFWSGLLSVATTVLPLIAGINEVHVQQPEPPPLGNTEIQILITGSAFVKGIMPFFEDVQPQYVESVENKINSLVNYYLGNS